MAMRINFLLQQQCQIIGCIFLLFEVCLKVFPLKVDKQRFMNERRIGKNST